jgi:hypothetical protein
MSRRLARAPLVLLTFAALGAGCSSGSGADTCTLSMPTDVGPGDLANVFPSAVGNRWMYDVSGSSSPAHRESVEVTGTRTVGGHSGSIFVQSRLDVRGLQSEVVYTKTASGVALLQDDSASAPLNRIFPYQILTFPLADGRSFSQVECSHLGIGQDLDGDGREEWAEIHSSVTLGGAEPLDVLGAVVDARRVETRLRVVAHATRNGAVSAQDLTEVAWYGPGIGLVKRVQTNATTGAVETAVLAGYALDGASGGLTRFAPLVRDFSPGTFDTGTPGQPAVAAHPGGFFVATRAATSAAPGSPFDPPGVIRSYLLDADGAPVGAVDLWSPALAASWSHTAVAFNGTDHLVITNTGSGTTDTIRAQRVSPAGELRDGANGFLVASGIFGAVPSVASDGTGWLAVWSATGPGVFAAPISPAGQVGAVATLRGFEPVGRAAVAFGGGVYLVAWNDITDVLAVRVAPDGTVLDSRPMVVASAAAAGATTLGGIAYGGGEFLVSWTVQETALTTLGLPGADVHAMRISTNGVLLDATPTGDGFVVNAAPRVTKADPTVAFTGGQFIIAWSVDDYGPAAGIWASRVSIDGVVDGPTSGSGLLVANPVNLSHLLHPVAIATPGDSGAVIAWVDNPEIAGTAQSIAAVWLTL